MGIESTTHSPRRCPGLAALLCLLLVWLTAPSSVPAQTQPTQATTVPLILPGGLAYDGTGNLFFAETAHHVIRRVSPTGVFTTVAGTGVQGFSGDGGAAMSALLDSPDAIALDPSGNLLIADSHNHRIRRVDAATGVITTLAGTGVAGQSPSGTLATAAMLDLPAALALDAGMNLFFADARTHLIRRIDHATGVLTTFAGNGTQGFSGDLGPATSASIDTPSGLTLDTAGNLYLADTHNQRIRRVDASSGIISTVAGTGQPGFSGDATAAAAATLRLPRGLSLDASGNLYLADSSNHRVRRIDAVTSQIATIAGDGTQAYAGDFNPAVLGSLNSPRAIAMSPSALPTVSDSANQRVRQVDSAAIIHTIAGLGTTTAGALTLAAPAVVLYGTGAVTATLGTSPASGSVSFFDTVAGTTQTLAAVPLAGNIAAMSTGALAAGSHRISATYQGDTLHSAAQSGTLSLTVSPAGVAATPASFNILYGQPVPALTGTLTGLLPQDAGSVTLALATTAAALSPPGAYPVTASLVGGGAGNYTLAAEPAFVTIAKAPTVSTLTAGLAVHVAPATSVVAAGTVNLLDGASTYASAALSASGDATFSSANLSLGTHTLTAVYAGDANLLPSASAPAVVTIGPVTLADFTLAATSQTTVTVPAGSPASFSFAVNPVNGALSSPIQLTVSGLPAGATASFNPAYLPQSNTPAAFILTIQTPKSASLQPLFPARTLVYAAMLPLLWLAARRRGLSPILVIFAAALIVGCGDRVAGTASTSASSRSYNITVIGTATSGNGATLQHTAAVTLTLQ